MEAVAEFDPRANTIQEIVDRQAAEIVRLRERVALLDRELDSVVAIVHDRAPELIEAVVAVCS